MLEWLRSFSSNRVNVRAGTICARTDSRERERLVGNREPWTSLSSCPLQILSQAIASLACPFQNPWRILIGSWFPNVRNRLIKWASETDDSKTDFPKAGNSRWNRSIKSGPTEWMINFRQFELFYCLLWMVLPGFIASPPCFWKVELGYLAQAHAKAEHENQKPKKHLPQWE